MADVFISYHRSDDMSELVRNIAQELESMGISCWYDTRDIYYDDFVKVILSELEQCKVFLLLLDKGAQESNYVRLEVNNSFPEYGKKIRPVFLKIGRFEIEKTLYARINQYNIPSCDSPKDVDAAQLVREIIRILAMNPPASAREVFPHLNVELYRNDDFPNGIPRALVLPLLDVGGELFTPPVSIQRTLPKVIQYGKCGDNIGYTLDNAGRLMISGVGPMQDYRGKRQAPWYPQREKVSHVYIQDGVIFIGIGAFYRCANLKSVVIPDSVTYIKDYAFCGCEKLTSVSVSATVNISIQAFDAHTVITRRK